MPAGILSILWSRVNRNHAFIATVTAPRVDTTPDSGIVESMGVAMSSKWIMGEQHRAVLRLALIASDNKKSFAARPGNETTACIDLVERDVMTVVDASLNGIYEFGLTFAGVKIAEQASIDCERCKSAYMDYVCQCCGRGMCDDCFPPLSDCPICKTERS